MKFVLVLLFCTFVYFALAEDDSDCHTSTTAVFECLQQKESDNKDADDKKKEEIKTKISKCFTDNSCKAPTFDKKGGSDAGRIKFEVQNTTKPVKDCLKNHLKKGVTDKINECLKKENVKSITIDDHDDFDLGGEGGTNPEFDEKLLRGAVAVAHALKKCEKDKDAKTRDTVVSCIKPIKDGIKKEICKRINECKDTANVSDACRKREKEVIEAGCKCKKDNFEEAAQNIQKLQKQGGDVDADQLDKAMPEGLSLKTEDLETVKKCYTDNKEPVPPHILAMQAAVNGGPLGIKPTISQATLQSIHEFLDSEAKNDECGCN